MLVIWDETHVYGRDYVERVVASLATMNEADVCVCDKVGYCLVSQSILKTVMSMTACFLGFFVCVFSSRAS